METIDLKVRVTSDVKNWLALRAADSSRSMNAELLNILKMTMAAEQPDVLVRQFKVATAEGITGRDTYILGKALIYAIAQIQSLPVRRQEQSDLADMRNLAKAAIDPRFLDLLHLTVSAATGVTVSMDEPDENDEHGFTP